MVRTLLTEYGLKIPRPLTLNWRVNRGIGEVQEQWFALWCVVINDALSLSGEDGGTIGSSIINDF